MNNNNNNATHNNHNKNKINSWLVFPSNFSEIEKMERDRGAKSVREGEKYELVLVMKHTHTQCINVERKKWRIYGTLIVSVDFFYRSLYSVLFLHSSSTRCAFVSTQNSNEKQEEEKEESRLWNCNVSGGSSGVGTTQLCAWTAMCYARSTTCLCFCLYVYKPVHVDNQP